MLDLNIKLPLSEFTLNVNTQIPKQRVTVIFGPSGCGKTSLLRCIAGLEKGAVGHVKYKDEVWQNASTHLDTYKRSVGYVFQEDSLFEHLTARRNLEFGLKRTSADKRFDFDEICRLLHIQPLLGRYPAQLSGGERRRVALGRTILANPALLLMDEPLTGLDKQRKDEILPYLEMLISNYDLPMIYVTHNVDEVTRLADYIITMQSGKIQNQGEARWMLTHDDNFLSLGEDVSAILHATVIEKDEKNHLAKVMFGSEPVWVVDKGYTQGDKIRIRILGRDVSVSQEKSKNTSIINSIKGNLIELLDDIHPGLMLLRIKVDEQMLLAKISRRSADNLALQNDQPIWVHIKSVAIL